MTEPAAIQTEPDLPPPPGLIRGVVGLVSAGAIATSLLWVYLTLISPDTKIWIGAAFSVVSLLAAGMGLFAAAGKFRSGYAMALLIFGGCLASSAAFAYVASQPNIAPSDLRLAKIWVVAQSGLGGAFGLLAAIVVLMRTPVAIRRLGLGVAFLIPAAAIAAAFYAFRAQLGPDPQGSSAGGVIRVSAIVFGALIELALISASGHWFIRAFEAGRLEADSAPGEGPETPENTKKPEQAPSAA